jgi:hypothetical protein
MVISTCLKILYYFLYRKYTALHWWLMSVIPATWEEEIRRIVVQSQPQGNSS